MDLDAQADAVRSESARLGCCPVHQRLISCVGVHSGFIVVYLLIQDLLWFICSFGVWCGVFRVDSGLIVVYFFIIRGLSSNSGFIVGLGLGGTWRKKGRIGARPLGALNPG